MTAIVAVLSDDDSCALGMVQSLKRVWNTPCPFSIATFDVAMGCINFIHSE